jgi:hypothetical protein
LNIRTFTEFMGAVIEQKFSTFFGGLQMKLEGDHTSFIDEPLIEACCTAGNPKRSPRQAEGVAVPVESFEFVGELTEDGRPARFAVRR